MLNDLAAFTSPSVKSVANTLILSKAPNEDECSWLKLISLKVTDSCVNCPVVGVVPEANLRVSLDA